MLRLFIAENTQLNDEELFEKWLALVGEERRQKVNALATRAQKNRSLAAGALLILGLRACGYDGGYKLAYGECGKPRLTQPQGVFFNLSHSGDYTVIALSDSEVGCDIQQLGQVDLRVADRYFSDGERAELAAAGEGANALFCRMWAAKESYLKALGTGLARPLSSFTVSFAGGGARLSDGGGDGGWSITEFGGIDGYALAVCSRRSAGGAEVGRISLTVH